MAITLAGTTGITTPGLTNSGNETITGTLNVGGLTPNVYPIVSGTAVASTSGTSIDFTSIPSWVKRITAMFNGVSTNGSSNVLLQVGSGSVQTTGYNGAGSYVNGTNSCSWAAFTTGAGINYPSSAYTRSGHIICTNVSGNIWVFSGSVGDSTSAGSFLGSTVTLSGTLDRVRITTVNGTDTFDAGSINLLWE